MPSRSEQMAEEFRRNSEAAPTADTSRKLEGVPNDERFTPPQQAGTSGQAQRRAAEAARNDPSTDEPRGDRKTNDRH